MRIAKIQAAIYLPTGAWPVLSMKSFKSVTGDKEDEWLVKTIGWLIVLSSLQLWESSNDRDIALLGIGWAAILGGSDAYYSLIKRRISLIYMLDAVLQAGIILGWINTLASDSKNG